MQALRNTLKKFKNWKKKIVNPNKSKTTPFKKRSIKRPTTHLYCSARVSTRTSGLRPNAILRLPVNSKGSSLRCGLLLIDCCGCAFRGRVSPLNAHPRKAGMPQNGTSIWKTLREMGLVKLPCRQWLKTIFWGREDKNEIQNYYNGFESTGCPIFWSAILRP